MSSPYIGEIRTVGFNFTPRDWVRCDGQLLSINDYDVLFNLIGTTYGGDGQTTFAVPNLNGRVVVGANGSQGPGRSRYSLGDQAGAENVTLINSQMPAHGHPVALPLLAAASGTASPGAVGQYPAPSPNGKPYAAAPTAGATLKPQAVTGTLGGAGGSQPHSNVQPVLALNFIMCANGIYPSPS
ncbi:phage tail protein [Hymenobacter ruricola]|uniref:Phage tail protein n=1 Tax=Hymenobacter ruricola TaxID=2791023 RepID=A0ABS0I7R1_9BACT|nr:tail fiber protein [Hymenobacter ruricola]MBF9222990.1 phage tail protein [Hymenobacter ruricola]